MDNKLQKLIDLSRKTGDRIIAFDQTGSNEPFVLMSVDEYENIVLGKSEVRGLTEDELVDKINRDIAIWKSDFVEQGDSPILNKIYNESQNYPRQEDGFDSIEDEEGEFEEEDDWHSFRDVVKKSGYSFASAKEKNSPRTKKGWDIPKDRKKNAEEIIDEDRYYLEDVQD